MTFAGCVIGHPPPPPPQPCVGKQCFTFSTQPRSQCVTADDPTSQGIFSRATSSSKYSYPNGVVTLFYDVEKRRQDNTIIGYTQVTRVDPRPSDDGPLSCDTGRNAADNSKELYFVRPLCATSKVVAPSELDCSNRPPEEKFATDFRHPPLFSIFADKAKIGPPVDCKIHCKPGAETPLCKILAAPPALVNKAAAAGIDWRQVLVDLRAEVINDKNYPISPARQEQILRIKPSDYGRGGDIYLRNNQTGQDGDAGALPFVFDDNGTEISADIQVGQLIVGERQVRNDTFEWIPDPDSTIPAIKFSDQTLDVLFGGPMTQMHLSPVQFVVGTQDRCVAVRY